MSIGSMVVGADLGSLLHESLLHPAKQAVLVRYIVRLMQQNKSIHKSRFLNLLIARRFLPRSFFNLCIEMKNPRTHAEELPREQLERVCKPHQTAAKNSARRGIPKKFIWDAFFVCLVFLRRSQARA